MRNLIIFCILLFLIIINLYPGDISTFVNLGFSADSRYFMLAQYGIKQNDSSPYADLFFIDVTQNTYAQYGDKSLSYKNKTEPGTFGIGALFNIIEENIALTNRYKIDHLATGRILYHLMNGEQSKQSFDFRDFVSGNYYIANLLQTISGKDKNIKSSFGITFTVKKTSGDSKTFATGHPAFQRTGVKGYRIKQIILSPDEHFIVFIVEREEEDSVGINIRYMIETLNIDF
jgi:predicted secreted protein